MNEEPNSHWYTEARVKELMAQAWDEGAIMRAHADPRTSVKDLNPYREAPHD